MLRKKLKLLGATPSKSEKRGLSLIGKGCKNILSLGISTCGFAEIRMAQQSKGRKIIATTVDEEGLKFTKKIISDFNLDKQVLAKLEDLREKMPYKDNSFDFIYARLVLHYLNSKDLDFALEEMHRILRIGKKCFIVIKSEKNKAGKKFRYDEITRFTTFDSPAGEYSRYLHTKESITSHLEKAGFTIIAIKEYKEFLYRGYMRTVKSKKASELIEILCQKI
jgi:ubiquinone/menaquinone biosynthesis C-methylase UbiE